MIHLSRNTGPYAKSYFLKHNDFSNTWKTPEIEWKFNKKPIIKGIFGKNVAAINPHLYNKLIIACTGYDLFKTDLLNKTVMECSKLLYEFSPDHMTQDLAMIFEVYGERGCCLITF